jgi:hypothetical protein
VTPTCCFVLVIASYVRLVFIGVKSVLLRVLPYGSVNICLILIVSAIVFVGVACPIVSTLWDDTCDGLDKPIAHEKAWGVVALGPVWFNEGFISGRAQLLLKMVGGLLFHLV